MPTDTPTASPVTIQTYIGIGSSGVSPSFTPYLDTFLGQPSGIFFQNLGPTWWGGFADQLYVIDSENNIWRTFLTGNEANATSGDGHFVLISGATGMDVDIGEDYLVTYSLDKLAGIQSYRVGSALYTMVPDRHSGTIMQIYDAAVSTAVLINIERERGLRGDCGPATLAATRYPTSVSVRQDKNEEYTVAFIDSGNNRVRGFEHTTWPNCISHSSTVCNTTGVMVNFNTGQACEGDERADCWISTPGNGPDWCAFECKQYGDLYPGKKPTFNVGFNRSSLNSLLNGTTYLDTGFMRPAWAKIYLMKEPFYFGNGASVPANVFLRGIVRGTSVRRLTVAEATTSPGDVPTELFPTEFTTLQFEIWGLSCVYWEFENNRCYMYSEEPELDCDGGTGSSGPAECRPGMMRTIMGSGPPGGSAADFDDRIDSMELFVSYHPLSITLGAPSGILAYERMLGATNLYEMDAHSSVFVSDTLQSRVIRKPAAPSENFHVEFSIFLASRYPEVLQHIVRNEHIVQAISFAITDYLLKGMRDDNDVQFKLTAMGRTSPPMGRTSACDPEGQRLLMEMATRKDNSVTELCKFTYCAGDSIFGFDSLECCAAGCDLCLGACDIEVHLLEVASTSVDACTAFANFRRCVSESPKCTSISQYQEDLNNGTCVVNSSFNLAFQDRMYSYDIHGNGGFDRLMQYCPGVSNETAFGLCESTYCDLVWFKILGVDAAYLGKSDEAYSDDAYRAASLQIVGMDFSAAFAHPESQLTVAERLAVLKRQELALKEAQGVYSWDYLRSDEGVALYGELYTFHHRILSYVNTLFQLNFHVCGNGNPCEKHTLELSISMSNWVDWLSDELHYFAWNEYVNTHSAMAIANRSWLESPYGMIADRAGRLLVCDQELHKIVMISRPWDRNTDIKYVAGSGWGGYNRDDIEATAADLSNPTDIAVDNKGIFYVADSGNHRVRSLHDLSSTQEVCAESDSYDTILRATDTELTDYKAGVQCYLNSLKTQLLLSIRNCLWCREESQNCNESLRPLCRDGNSSEPNALLNYSETLPDCTGCESTNGCGDWEPDMFSLENFTCDGFDDDATGYDPWTVITCQTNVLSDLTINVFAMGLQVMTEQVEFFESTNAWLGSSGVFADAAGVLGAAQSVAMMFDGQLLKNESEKLRVDLCQDEQEPQYAMRNLLYYWYLALSEGCASRFGKNENALVGAMYYTPKNLIPQIYMMPLFKPEMERNEPSQCHPGCHLGQPMHLSGAAVMPTVSSQFRCCGTMGYRCGEGEGICKRDSDCKPGLHCHPGACPSGVGMGLVSCCLAGGVAGTLRGFRESSLLLVAHLEERELLRNWFV